MSGGSYDYLCFKDGTEIRENMDSLQSMADRLAGLPWAQDAAQETIDLILMLRQQRVWAETFISRLSGVWRAVEWCDSGDTGEDHIQAELKTYRAAKVPAP